MTLKSFNKFLIFSLGTFGHQATAFSVRVGSTKNFEDGSIHQVATVKNHPNFNRVTYDFDVALLLLQTSIKIDDITTQEIQMASTGERLPLQTAVPTIKLTHEVALINFKCLHRFWLLVGVRTKDFSMIRKAFNEVLTEKLFMKYFCSIILKKSVLKVFCFFQSF